MPYCKTDLAILAFWHGATVFYSNLERFWKSHGSPDVQLAAHINVYAKCGWSLKDDDEVMKPMLFLHGPADDWALPASCREYAARLSKAGKDVRFVEYPDAQHAYDAPAFKMPLTVAAGQKWGDCRVGEENNKLTNKDTGQPFAFGDACVKTGTTGAMSAPRANRA
jgi:hypothetical protein